MAQYPIPPLLLLTTDSGALLVAVSVIAAWALNAFSLLAKFIGMGAAEDGRASGENKLQALGFALIITGFYLITVAVCATIPNCTKRNVDLVYYAHDLVLAPTMSIVVC
ncbi:hypothetical protein CLAFUW4_06541 [Fulvia fulva]|nr:hypothetical protein CLAFUR4_06549 [Fulvia fulva]KAK4622586.1 hypothetical protein CLAFUR0_06545 [Fulvia fulva]WPV16263.1 hypothetical protein CLAFUW4_06541 [Fulvia fulva]WPV31264.1 hypothetical protein CLAFUW7_06540 [Fulvia fulva]